MREIMRHRFSEEDIARCKQFAASSTNNYGTRNQRNTAVITRQIYQGKLGEITAWNCLFPICIHISEPDFQIYSARQKSWKPDLSGCNSDYHVKTMGSEQAALYGLSWTFQFSNQRGKGGKDTEIFSDGTGAKAFIAFVEVDTKKSQGLLHAVIHAKRLFDDNLLRDPKLEHLKGIKKVVYAADLEAAGLLGHRDDFGV